MLENKDVVVLHEMLDRITEYSELEGTPEDPWVQLVSEWPRHQTHNHGIINTMF